MTVIAPSAKFLAQFASLALAEPTLPPATPAPMAAAVAPSAPADPAPAAAPAPAPADDLDAIPRVPGEADPLQPINRVFYAVNQPIDRFLIRPVAIAYKTVIPHPARDGVRNAIQNLYEPIVIFNDLLQLRPGRAVKGIFRFLINSTVGLGGLFDVARHKPFHIAHHDNGFADTLGVIGIPPIAYLYLPVLGPMTLRDAGGDYVDDLAEPRILHKILHPDSDKPIWKARVKMGTTGTVIYAVQGIDERAESDQELENIRTQSVDPYAALRTSYLQDRAGEIAALKAHDGKPPKNAALDDPLEDPAASNALGK